MKAIMGETFSFYFRYLDLVISANHLFMANI